MIRIADLLEHPRDVVSYAGHSLAHQRKSTVGGVVFLALLVVGIAWMWPEIQRYIKIKRM